MNRRWNLIGVPYTSMARPGGIASAIGVLRAGGLVERLASLGVRDAGDLDLEPPSGERGPSGLMNERALARLVDRTHAAVAEALHGGRRALLVGGDCPVLLGALAAIADEGTPGLVMVDGHEDAWPPSLSPTGEASDSELAIALGRVDRLPPPLAELMPLVDPRHVALLGPRDETEIAEGGVPSVHRVVGRFLGDNDVRRDGDAMASALDAIGDVPFWLHVDLDVLATEDFAAVDYPQPGGLTWAELDGLMAVALAHPRNRGLSVVIYNPDLDPDRSAAAGVVEFIGRSIGRAPTAPRT